MSSNVKAFERMGYRIMTSQDGGDNTSITSGVENEIKKPLVGIMKTKRNSIKRKVQNFSHESDDAVIEPLLQKDKKEVSSQSAKHMLPKSKTESSSKKGDDTDKLLSDGRVEKPSLSTAPSAIGSTSAMNGTKEIIKPKLLEGSSTINNHMNTNIFGTFDGVKNICTPKTQILVEIDSSKSTGYNPSPLIFTTAKIHTDGSTKHMEPVQVTPVPILSTIEGSVKIGVGCTENIVSAVSPKENSMIDTNNAKSNHTESKTVKDSQNITKTSTTTSNPSYSEIPSTVSSSTSQEKKDAVDAKEYNPSNKTLANISSIMPIDINNVPTKTIKSDLNTVCSNASTKYNFEDKESDDSFKTCANVVDVNKNIEMNKTLSLQGKPFDNHASSTSSSMPKSATELEKKTDSNSPDTKTISSKVKNIDMLPDANKSKINDDDIYNRKVTTSIPLHPNSNSISSANNDSASTKTFSVQITSNLTSKNVTSAIAATTSTLIKSTSVSTTSKTVTSTSTLLACKPVVSTTAMSVKTSTTCVVSTDKSTVPNELPSSKTTAIALASDIVKKSTGVSSLKMPMSSQSSKVKSTVSTVISNPKISATKTIPTSNSIKNVTSAIKTQTTQIPQVNTVSMVTSTVAATTNSNILKSFDSSAVNSKPNNLTKTISPTANSNKSFNMPLTNVVTNSNRSTVSTAKTPEIATKVTKSTASVSKPTSVVTSKPAESTATKSDSIKQSSIKVALAKSNSSTVSSVKTLITSNDKPSSSSGSVKKSSIKTPNKQTETKGADGKKA